MPTEAAAGRLALQRPAAMSSMHGDPLNPPLTRRQAVSSAMATFKRIKDSRFGVGILKGSLAVAQAAVLITLLVLSTNTLSVYGEGYVQSEIPPEACNADRMEMWMEASIARLLVCWLVSLWIVWRKPLGSQVEQESGPGGEEATR